MTPSSQPQNEATSYLPIFVARQPIFNRQGDIWGYELLYRASANVCMDGSSPSTATSRVISDGLSLALNSISDSKKILINFSRHMLLVESATVLPPEICIPEILEDVGITPEIISAVKELKKAGYSIAVDDYIGQPGMEPLLKLADIVKVDMLGMSLSAVEKLSRSLTKYDCELLAEKVENRGMYDLAVSLDYSYFQGYYFAKPELIKGRKISSSMLTQFQLMEKLASPDYEVNEVAETLSRDVGLSHRLLRYASAVARLSEIRSLGHAVSLLGLKPLKQWLMITMLSDTSREDRSMELVYQSARRGKFMELITDSIADDKFEGESLFLLGLFSNLDGLLGSPMDEVAGHLPLEKSLTETLCGEKTPFSSLLSLVKSVEAGQWDSVAVFLQQYSISETDAAKAYAEAGKWAHEILSDNKTK
ncbi:EAL and HDOD domain-containing protein [Desulfovibrio sp. JC010]|uniref:EAL and HDOD domain-containing protein n=1 Tax=Desulfovibrio sp. JC010 TaxID=2593641 RepID=UPI0013D83BE8|nr:HDOD domain-containing protein [Desulfovibrio sp. JC010]NDV25277.1 HDOD domain-containing protein [Desulfovibrio sp. JC010]